MTRTARTTTVLSLAAGTVLPWLSMRVGQDRSQDEIWVWDARLSYVQEGRAQSSGPSGVATYWHVQRAEARFRLRAPMNPGSRPTPERFVWENVTVQYADSFKSYEPAVTEGENAGPEHEVEWGVSGTIRPPAMTAEVLSSVGAFRPMAVGGATVDTLHLPALYVMPTEGRVLVATSTIALMLGAAHPGAKRRRAGTRRWQEDVWVAVTTTLPDRSAADAKARADMARADKDEAALQRELERCAMRAAQADPEAVERLVRQCNALAERGMSAAGMQKFAGDVLRGSRRWKTTGWGTLGGMPGGAPATHTLTWEFRLVSKGP